MYRKNYLYPSLALITFTCLSLFNSNLFVDTCYAEKYTLIPGVIHIHTNIGTGGQPPEEIVKIEKEKGIKGIVFTDHDTMKWTYGVPPLRKIIQKVVDQNSILKYGAANYINTIEELNKKYPDMLILHGAEAIPFYYWQGSFFKNNNEIINSISVRYNKTPAQVMLNWLIAHKNLITIPRVSSLEHLKENIGSCGWKLNKEDFDLISNSFLASK